MWISEAKKTNYIYGNQFFAKAQKSYANFRLEKRYLLKGKYLICSYTLEGARQFRLIEYDQQTHNCYFLLAWFASPEAARQACDLVAKGLLTLPQEQAEALYYLSEKAGKGLTPLDLEY